MRHRRRRYVMVEACEDRLLLLPTWEVEGGRWNGQRAPKRWGMHLHPGSVCLCGCRHTAGFTQEVDEVMERKKGLEVYAKGWS